MRLLSHFSCRHHSTDDIFCVCTENGKCDVTTGFSSPLALIKVLGMKERLGSLILPTTDREHNVFLYSGKSEGRISGSVVKS